MRFCKLGKVFKETYCVLYSRVLRKRWSTYLFFDMHLNQPFWYRLKVRILLYFAHANEVRRTNDQTCKRIYSQAAVMKEIYTMEAGQFC